MAYSFVSVDKEDKVVGYFGFRIQHQVAESMIFINFIPEEYLIYGLDFIQLLNEIFLKLHCTAVHFYLRKDNPKLPYYQSIVKTFGGTETLTPEGHSSFLLSQQVWLTHKQKTTKRKI
jgi:hypothetical protein